MPTKRNPREVDQRDFPVYRERCATPECDHPQEQHIRTSMGYLTGEMIPCRTEGCSCAKWSPSWATTR